MIVYTNPELTETGRKIVKILLIAVVLFGLLAVGYAIFQLIASSH